MSDDDDDLIPDNVSKRQRKNMSDNDNDDAVLANVKKYQYLEHVRDLTTNVVYYFTKKLGEGAGGRTFAATIIPGEVAKFAVKDAWSRIQPPPDAGADLLFEIFFEAAEREWRVNQTIAQRTSADFYKNWLICATHAFFDLATKRACIVFPLIEGHSLFNWMQSYACKVAWDVIYSESGDSAEFEKIHTLSLTDPSALSEVDRKRLSDFKRYQTWMFYIAGQLVYAVHRLHLAGIFHLDIKPDNIILDTNPTNESLPADVPQVRLMDFGLSCVINPNQRDDDDDEDFRLPSTHPDLEECSDGIAGTITYRDPLGLYIPQSGDSVKEFADLKGRFDVYSLAKTIAEIFDPDMSMRVAKTNGVPLVESYSRYMPTALYNLLRDAVGHENIKKKYQRTGYKELTADEYDSRFAAMEFRPSMATFYNRFQEILKETGL